MPARASATYVTTTTQPCHAEGGPQPQPFRLAGNQCVRVPREATVSSPPRWRAGCRGPHPPTSTSPATTVGAGHVQRHRRANQSRHCLLVDPLALVEVDGTPRLAFE